jgi:hypothetical protein
VTPLDFFLWGYVKDVMCQARISDLPDPNHRIISAVVSVTLEIPEDIWTKSEYRFDVCCPAKVGTCQDLLTRQIVQSVFTLLTSNNLYRPSLDLKLFTLSAVFISDTVFYFAFLCVTVFFSLLHLFYVLHFYNCFICN